MKKKNIIIIVIVIVLIVLLGIGGCIWWGGRKVVEKVKEFEQGAVGPGEQEEEEEEEEEGEICGIPFQKYPNMTKFMEEKDEEAGTCGVMYYIEGPDRTEEIKNFYKTKLAAAGWKIESEEVIMEMLLLTFSKGENYSLEVGAVYGKGITQFWFSYEGPGTKAEENPYDSVSSVDPASDLNSAFHNDFKSVLVSIFGGAKLTSSSSDKYSEDLDYIVKRIITKEDAQQVRALLEAKGYVTTSTKAETNVYRYDFSKEMLGETYDDINVDVRLEEEGSRQQKVSISIYK